MTVQAVLGVDVGGTSIKARLVGANDAVLAEWREPTPRDDPRAVALADVVGGLAVRAVAAARAADSELRAIGLVVPGVVDDASGTVVLAVNLGWRDVAVRAAVLDRLLAVGVAVPVAFGQDVRAGALAEARSGSGGTGGTVAFVPVGTGLAAALVTDGTVVGAHAWAGEIGQVMLTTGPHAGARVEEIASASAVARRLGEPNARAAAERVEAGDPVAVEIWNDCVSVLADALAWTTVVGGCASIIIGGGLAEAGPALFQPLRAALALRLRGMQVPAIVRAAYGDAAGAMGAVLMARDALTTRDGAAA